MNFFDIDIGNYFLILFQLTTCKKLQFLLFQSATCSHHISEGRFFSRLVRLLFIVGQMKSEAIVLVLEGVYVTIGHPAFCLFLYLTGVHFRGELQHGGDVVSKKSSVDQSEREKQVVSYCQMYYMLGIASKISWVILNIIVFYNSG